MISISPCAVVRLMPSELECRSLTPVKRFQKDMMIARIVRDHHDAAARRSRRWHGAGTPDSRNSPESAAGRQRSRDRATPDRAQRPARTRPSPSSRRAFSLRVRSRTPRNRKCRRPRTNAHRRARRVLFRISIERPSRAATKSRLNAPNEKDRSPCGGIFAGSPISRSSTNEVLNCTMRLWVPQGWTVARADREAEPAIEIAGRVEVADDMHDMVDALGQRLRSLHRRERRRHQELIDDVADDLAVFLGLGARRDPFLDRSGTPPTSSRARPATPRPGNRSVPGWIRRPAW